jgi:hypothetical protein
VPGGHRMTWLAEKTSCAYDPASTRGYLERVRELAEQAARARAEAAQVAAARRNEASP